MELRISDDDITRQALQWTPEGHRSKGQPKNTWRRNLKKEIGRACFKYSWKKMKVVAQDIAGWRQMVCGHVLLGATKHKSNKSSNTGV